MITRNDNVHTALEKIAGTIIQRAAASKGGAKKMLEEVKAVKAQNIATAQTRGVKPPPVFEPSTQTQPFQPIMNVRKLIMNVRRETKSIERDYFENYRKSKRRATGC